MTWNWQQCSAALESFIRMSLQQRKPIGLDLHQPINALKVGGLFYNAATQAGGFPFSRICQNLGYSIWVIPFTWSVCGFALWKWFKLILIKLKIIGIAITSGNQGMTLSLEFQTYCSICLSTQEAGSLSATCYTGPNRWTGGALSLSGADEVDIYTKYFETVFESESKQHPNNEKEAFDLLQFFIQLQELWFKNNLASKKFTFWL